MIGVSKPLGKTGNLGRVYRSQSDSIYRLSEATSLFGDAGKESHERPEKIGKMRIQSRHGSRPLENLYVHSRPIFSTR